MNLSIINDIVEEIIDEKMEQNNIDKINIHHNKNDFVSGPLRVENGTIPINILEFEYPFIFIHYQ